MCYFDYQCYGFSFVIIFSSTVYGFLYIFGFSCGIAVRGIGIRVNDFQDIQIREMGVRDNSIREFGIRDEGIRVKEFGILDWNLSFLLTTFLKIF